MKRRMEDPQGQSTPSNKRPRIQTEEDFQQAFAQILDIPDFPAEPPRFAAGPESLVRVPTFAAEKEIERLLGLNAQAKPLFASSTGVRHRSKIPEEFSTELRKKYQRGELDGKVLNYYSDILPRGDSKSVPGQGGRALLLKSIMRQEDALPASLIAGPAWRPVRALGKGGFGEGASIEKSSPYRSILSHGGLMHAGHSSLHQGIALCPKRHDGWRIDADRRTCCSDALGEDSQEQTSEWPMPTLENKF